MEMKDDLKVMKINTDNYPKLASKYRIQVLSFGYAPLQLNLWHTIPTDGKAVYVMRLLPTSSKLVAANLGEWQSSLFSLQALPTCLLFRDGMVIDRVDGFMPEATFGRRIRFYVARLDKKFGRRWIWKAVAQGLNKCDSWHMTFCTVSWHPHFCDK